MKNKLLLLVYVVLLFHYSLAKEPGKKPAQKPRNIIFLIGDGMGLAQISAGLYAKGKSALERFRKIGFIKTYSADNLITDSAAGATAFACGMKTYNGAIGVDIEKKPCKTILESAQEQGMATGLVVTCSFTHATPAAFFAHQPSRNMDEAIAYDLLKTPVNILVAGGEKFLTERSDKKNLTDSLKARKYDLVYSAKAFDKSQSAKIFYFTAREHPKSIIEGREQYLATATAIATQKLSRNRKGFFLMVEGSQIDWGGHANNSDYIISEMMEFDDAVEAALSFAEKDKNTLVVVTADHETGGYAITGGNLKEQKIEARFATDEHTGTLIPVFAFGPGADEFSGIYENTQIYHKMMRLLGLVKQ